MMKNLTKYTLQGTVTTAAVIFGLAAMSAQAQGDLDFSIGDDTAKVQVSSDVPYNDLSWTAELLHFDNSEFNANIIGGGIFVAGRSNASTARQTAGVGGKFLLVEGDGIETGSGIAIGGFIRHTLSQANLISLRGEMFIAPGIISFQGMESYLEYSARVEYQLLDQANVYLGYRNVQADFDLDIGGEAEVEFDEGIIAGLSLRF